MISALFIKIIPVYLYIFLGYIASRYLDISMNMIGKLLLYIINPIFFFSIIALSDMSLSDIWLPITTFLLLTLMAVISFLVTQLFWKDTTRYLLSSSIPSGNTGYFGIPIALILFSPPLLSLYILANFGITLFQNSLGYYILARSKFSFKESIMRLLKFPLFYAVPLGFLFSILDFPLPSFMQNVTENLKNTYIVLGMMLVGLALGKASLSHFNWKFLAVGNTLRFIIWPIVTLALVQLDTRITQFFDPEIYKIFLLFSFVPVGSNLVVYAAELKTHVTDAATLVLTSTILAMIVIPIAYFLFLS